MGEIADGYRLRMMRRYSTDCLTPIPRLGKRLQSLWSLLKSLNFGMKTGPGYWISIVKLWSSWETLVRDDKSDSDLLD